MKRGVFIETANVTAFRRAVSAAEDTEAGRPGMLLAWGEAGMGKTMAALNSYSEGGGIYLRAWEDWTQHAFLQALAFEALGTRPHGANKCKVAIIEALDSQRRTIYVDEADRLKTGRLEDLRDIHDMTGAPIVLLGEQGLPTLVAGRSRIDDRIPSEYRVRFGAITTADISVYALEAADLRISPQACKIVHGKCKGNFRRAHNLVLSLEAMARAAETDTVDEAMAARLGGGK